MQAERERLRKAYGALFAILTDILFRHDPIGINVGDNTDEYDPEVVTILPRLETATSEEAVLYIIHEEFVTWFDADIAGPSEAYKPIAKDIWSAWQAFRTSSAHE